MKGYRKVIVISLAVTCGFVLALLGKLTGDYVTIAVAAVGAFSAANAYEHKVSP